MTRGLLIGIVILLTGEIFMRMAFGFTDAVLYREDSEIEYLPLPNQDRNRFGNNIRYNEFSMRSEPLVLNSRKILGLGDSILNGGVLCDQEVLATYLLEHQLNKDLAQDIQVLNISAPSWGPDNAMAFLQKFGNFNAEVIFLVTSSHDAFDTMDFTPVVGIHKNYPEEQYTFAYTEGIDRYLLPWLGRNFENKNDAPGGFNSTRPSKIFNKGFLEILEYTDKREIPFLIYLHPELSEVKKGSYNKMGQLILEFARKNNISVITGLEGAREDHYLDNIHLNEKGQKYLFEKLYSQLKNKIFSRDLLEIR